MKKDASMHKQEYWKFHNLLLNCIVQQLIVVLELGQAQEMLAYNETALYIEDWIGLKTLDEAGKLDFLTSPGGHLQFTHEFFFDVVDKYFKN